DHLGRLNRAVRFKHRDQVAVGNPVTQVANIQLLTHLLTPKKKDRSLQRGDGQATQRTPMQSFDENGNGFAGRRRIRSGPHTWHRQTPRKWMVRSISWRTPRGEVK